MEEEKDDVLGVGTYWYWCDDVWGRMYCLVVCQYMHKAFTGYELRSLGQEERKGERTYEAVFMNAEHGNGFSWS